MSSLRKSTAALFLVGALATAAHAGQTFSFQNNFGPTDFDNNFAFETTNNGFAASIENFINRTIDLRVVNYDANGVFQTDTTYTGVTFDLATQAGESVLPGALQSSNQFLVQDGLVTFTKDNVTLLSVSFDAALLNFTGTGPSASASLEANTRDSQPLTFGGTLYRPTETDPSNFGIGLISPISTPTRTHWTGDFNASIGNVAPVPEPASMATLAIGGLALLRRRRRA